MKVFSFIPADGSWKFTFNADLKVFFNYLAQSQGYPISNQNLIGKSRELLSKYRADFCVKSSSRALSPSLVLRLLTQCRATRPV